MESAIESGLERQVRPGTPNYDVLSREQRHLVMSRIGGKNTKPEMLIRRGLHARGLRYKLHVSGLPGKPDIVLPRYRTAIFVHGCFWHGHGCSLFRWPKTRADFWKKKLRSNMKRDQRILTALEADGWRVLLIWECALKGKQRRQLHDVLNKADSFIRTKMNSFETIEEIRNSTLFGNFPP